MGFPLKRLVLVVAGVGSISGTTVKPRKREVRFVRPGVCLRSRTPTSVAQVMTQPARSCFIFAGFHLLNTLWTQRAGLAAQDPQHLGFFLGGGDRMTLSKYSSVGAHNTCYNLTYQFIASVREKQYRRAACSSARAVGVLHV